jgi:hypothetical protein
MNGANQDEVIYWIDPTNGDIWERTGGCSQCGDCCEEEGNGFSVIDGNGQPNPVEKVVEGKCAYFRWENDGKCSCAGMNTRYYQNGCRFIPTKPNHIVDWPNCTYVFTKIN